MRLEDALGLRFGGKDALEARLGGQLVWSAESADAAVTIRDANFSNNELGVMYIPIPVVAGQQLLWQDAAMTVPVTGDSQRVRVMMDFSGNGHHASAPSDAARPLYRTDGTLHWLQGDGVDDFLATQPIAPVPTTGSGMSAIFANEPTRGFVRLGQYQAPDDRVFSFGTTNNMDILTYNFSVQEGASFNSNRIAALDAPLAPHVASAEWHGSGKNRLRINSGAWAESSSELNSRSETGPRQIDIFRSAPGEIIGEGKVFGILIRQQYLSSSDLEDVESYFASLAGVTL